MSVLLNEKWQDTKEALLEGLQGHKRSVMGVTLENTRRYLAESATAGSTSAGNVATLNRVSHQCSLPPLVHCQQCLSKPQLGHQTQQPRNS
jgi:hypothetical protein